MPKTKKVEIVNDVQVVEAVDAVTVVCNKRGRETERVYTRDVHGDTFMELATEFAKKIGGTLVKE